MSWNEMLWSPWIMPLMRPVSVCGKRPFGMSMMSATLSAMVAKSASMTSRGWRSALPSERP